MALEKGVDLAALAEERVQVAKVHQERQQNLMDEFQLGRRFANEEATRRSESIQKEMNSIVMNSSSKGRYLRQYYAEAKQFSKQYWDNEVKNATDANQKARAEQRGGLVQAALTEAEKKLGEEENVDRQKKIFGVAQGIGTTITAASGAGEDVLGSVSSASQAAAGTLKALGGAAGKAAPPLMAIGLAVEVLDAVLKALAGPVVALQKEQRGMSSVAGMYRASVQEVVNASVQSARTQRDLALNWGQSAEEFSKVRDTLASSQAVTAETMEGAQAKLKIAGYNAMALGEAIGMSGVEVATLMGDFRTRFSVAEEDTIRAVAMLSKIQETTKLPMEVVKSTTFDMAMQLRQFGYNVVDAGILTEQFGKAIYNGVLDMQDVVGMLTGMTKQKPGQMLFMMGELTKGALGPEFKGLASLVSKITAGKSITDQIGAMTKLTLGEYGTGMAAQYMKAVSKRTGQMLPGAGGEETFLGGAKLGVGNVLGDIQRQMAAQDPQKYRAFQEMFSTLTKDMATGKVSMEDGARQLGDYVAQMGDTTAQQKWIQEGRSVNDLLQVGADRLHAFSVALEEVKKSAEWEIAEIVGGKQVSAHTPDSSLLRRGMALNPYGIGADLGKQFAEWLEKR